VITRFYVQLEKWGKFGEAWVNLCPGLLFFRLVYFTVMYKHLELGISAYKINVKSFVNPWKKKKE